MSGRLTENMTQIQLPAGVGYTGLMTAYNRAVETARPDALFTDPHAVRFAAIAGDTTQVGLPRLGPPEGATSELWTGLNAYLAARTVYYDRALLAALSQGTRQVVLPGAGLDTRAYRMALPGDTTLYEVDTPAVHDFKTTVLDGTEPAVRRVVVEADLRADWAAALTAAGFDRTRPTIWVLEGLLMYFPVPAANTLLGTVSALSTPGSTLLTEYFSRRPRHTDLTHPTPEDRPLTDLLVGNIVAGPDPDPVSWLAARGWRGATTDLADQLTRLGRPVPAMFGQSGPDPLRVHLIEGKR